MEDSSSEAVLVEKAGKAKTRSGGGIVATEKVESGQVKASVVLEYLRACRLWLTWVFLVLRAASYVSGVGANFWLSDWSNEAAATADKDFAIKSKFYRLAIYALLCFTDRKQI